MNDYISSKYWRLYRPFFFFYQRITRGFDDSDLWNLDHTISKFILPRLIAFKDYQNGWPGNFQQENESDEETSIRWQSVIDDIIFFHQAIVDGDKYGFYDEPDKKLRYDDGKEYFIKYYENLWD